MFVNPNYFSLCTTEDPGAMKERKEIKAQY